ncbi:LYR motif-containing protein 2-like protein [Mycotypha africana]|uniref:LYR motif-containing protein 2-like protein n=1 Tax=Mycotypha africana TaxID=64632 RepID=UPI0022FFDFFD|nr:LYR motif-containing protein 2-like protein [Mycotypha africana]KAI8988496.1 LYR motif-containing protein 2-like protein [Mycotypha africana]
MLITLVRLQKAPAVPKFFKEAPTLDHFLVRAQVISLYRQIVRCTKGMDKTQAKELLQWARADFERHRFEKDIENIRSLITSGKHQMHSLQSSVMLAQVSKH